MATRLRLLGLVLIATTLLAALLATTGIAQRPAQARPIAGQVKDANGALAAGVTVCLRWRAHPELPAPYGHSLAPAGNGGSAIGQGERLTATDAKGRFRFQPPHRGPFLLIAFGKDRRDSSPRVFPVMPGSYHKLRLEPSFFMAGRVVDGNGVAMSEARVQLAPTTLQWERAGFYNEPERRSVTVSDEQGKFRLLFEHGYLRTPRWDILSSPLAVKGKVSSCAAMEPMRPVRSARELTLTLGNTPAVSGLLSDHRGKPLAGAMTWDPRLPGAVATSDGQGRYAMPACSGSLWARANGCVPVLLASGNAPDQNASLVPGHVLKFGLRDARGALANARVLWVLPQSYAMSPEWIGRTDDHGKVEARGLPPAQLLGFVEVEGRFRHFFAGNISGDDEHEVQLPTGVAVRGQVVSKDELPLAGVRVALWPKLDVKIVTPYVTYTDHGGRFAFDPVSGPHSLAVDAGGHGGTSLVVEAEDLGQQHVLQLPDTPGITGQVFDVDGKPAAGAWVTASRTVTAHGTYAPALRISMQAHCTMADDEGRFTFTGMPANGVWSVVGAWMRDDIKYNARESLQTGGKTTLRLAVEQQ